jgi:hypothetical protein
MLEFVSRELKFKFDGVEYLIKFPSARELANYATEYQKNEDKFEVVFSFLEKLGLTREVSEKMELSSLMKIIETLNDEKKN